MKNVLRRALALLVLVVALQLLIGVTTVLADPGYHIVQPKETLFSIGRLYGVSPWTIAQVNGLANPSYIQIGQVLYIPSGCGAPAPAPAPSWGYQPPQWQYQPAYGWGQWPAQWYPQQGYPGYYYHPVSYWPWNWQYSQYGGYGWYGHWQYPQYNYGAYWNWQTWDP
jgi:hypothetical protein